MIADVADLSNRVSLHVARVRRLRRGLAPAVCVMASLLLAACADTPNASVTASLSQGGATIQMVVTSDTTAIAAIQANKFSNDPNFPAVTFTSGDTHTAPHVCGFSVSNSRHSYQVDYYGNVQTGAGSQVCSAAVQQQFLAAAP